MDLLISLLLIAKYVLCCITVHVPSWDFRSGRILWTDSEMPLYRVMFDSATVAVQLHFSHSSRNCKCGFLAFRDGCPVGRGGLILEGRGTLEVLPLKSFVRTCFVKCGRMLFVGWITCWLIWTTTGRTELLCLVANLASNIRHCFDHELDKDDWRFVLGFTGTVRLEYLKFT